MKWLALLLVVHQTLAQSYNPYDCVIDYRTLENTWEQKLIRDFHKCNYDSSEPPPQNTTEPLKIKMRLVLKSYNYISKEQAFWTYTWVLLSWHDERLKWDPTKYENIELTSLMSYDIWTPEIRLMNSISDEYDQSYFFGPCVVKSTGEVSCIAFEEFETKCDSNLSDWPFDAQTCKLEFSPIAKGEPKQLLEVGKRPITIIDVQHGSEWDITDYQQQEDRNSEKQLKMTYRLERHAGVLSAIVIFPSLILTVLTLSSLFLDIRRNIRLVVICFSLMCHFDFLSELASKIPEHSSESPRLLFYYRGSFILTSILIVLSIVLNVMCRKETACPKWIISSNDFVYTKFVQFLIWPRWETKVKEDANASKFTKDWADFANVVNTVWIIISVIIYVCMYCVLIPHEAFISQYLFN